MGKKPERLFGEGQGAMGSTRPQVAALLRVSTLRQVRNHRDSEETIPMRRAAIRRFVASRPGVGTRARIRRRRRVCLVPQQRRAESGIGSVSWSGRSPTTVPVVSSESKARWTSCSDSSLRRRLASRNGKLQHLDTRQGEDAPADRAGSVDRRQATFRLSPPQGWTPKVRRHAVT